MDIHPGAIFGFILVVVIIAINILAGNTKVKPRKYQSDDRHLRMARAQAGIQSAGYQSIAARARNKRR